MILRHADVRAAAKDWKKFSSDAPFRVPIPSEEELRTMRQLPIEMDPPEHTEYRKIVEPFFKRAKDPEVVAKVELLIGEMVDGALGGDSVEIVRDFALPIQSRALGDLLNVPEKEAEIWTSWGIHVFRDGEDGEVKGETLEKYLHARFDQAEEDPADDFFSALTKAEFQGRRLERDEMMGFANLTFAGGRDTVIHSISGVVSHHAKCPGALDFLREEPKRIINASEEFFRVISPLTHIGRVCPVETDVHGVSVAPNGRVSLCWASANFDGEAFEAPEETRLDRKPNPHIAFGAGTHICLGAPHARLIVRTLLKVLVEKVGGISILQSKENIENEARYRRSVGYESLTVRMT